MFRVPTRTGPDLELQELYLEGQSPRNQQHDSDDSVNAKPSCWVP